MFLLYCNKIRKREVGTFPQIFTDQTIKKLAGKVASGLGEPLGNFSGGTCVKLYATSKGGAGRTAWRIAGKQIILLLARSKKDAIGKNMTLKNPAFLAALKKAFDLVESDLVAGDFEIIDL